MSENHMPGSPTLLFLHGVGDGDPDDIWKARLDDSLAALGYPSLSSVDIVAPKYAHALKGFDEKETVPALTISQPTGSEARDNRREFERRTAAIELRIGRHDKGDGIPGGAAMIDGAVRTPPFRQARNYLDSHHVRAQVLNRILSMLPVCGQVVIVAHSLGSVIAADLIRRLSPDLHVVGMLTIGSPLASGRFNVDNLRDTLKQPPTNLAWWVNVWNWFDPVAARRGVSSVFPWMIDVRIQSPLSPAVHAAVQYLSDPVVVEAVGFALFGSKSTELARVERGVELAPDHVELMTMLALRYSQLIELRLTGDQKERYAGARRAVQAIVIEGLFARCAEQNRPVPSAIARLAFDNADPNEPMPDSLPAAHMSKEDAVVPLTVLAAENVLRPFEISVPQDKRRDAMSDLSAEMGLGSLFGADVFAAAKTAQEAVRGQKINWFKWGALAAGAAALVAATGGLALAAGSGLVGAAAITSALAAFGPGGMIGGLLTAGTLVTAGGGGIAFALASPGTTAETLEAVVERQLAAAVLRDKHHLPWDHTVWRNLVETEIEIRRQHERLDEFSDASASSIKELQRKLEAVKRAIAFMEQRHLDPEYLEDDVA